MCMANNMNVALNYLDMFSTYTTTEYINFKLALL